MSDAQEQRAADRREIEKLHPGERFRMMLDAPTPETDAVKRELCLRSKVDSDLPMNWNWVVPAEFAGQLERERDEAREALDLMADEFMRIKSISDVLPGVAHICERAISGIKQRVPLIVQRDSAEAERDQLRARVAELEMALKPLIGLWDKFNDDDATY